MTARIVRIGIAEGVWIARHLLEEAGIDGEVELRIRAGRIVIEPARRPREGWEEAAEALGAEQRRAAGGDPGLTG